MKVRRILREPIWRAPSASLPPSMPRASTGTQSSKTRSTSSAASPSATTALTGGTVRCERREVDAFAAAAGDQHDVLKPAYRGERCMRIGRLRVVDVRDPVELGDHLEPMAERPEATDRARDRSAARSRRREPPRPPRPRPPGRRLPGSGMSAAAMISPPSHTSCPHSRPIPPGGRTRPENGTMRARCVAAILIAHVVVDVGQEDVVGALVLGDARLWRARTPRSNRASLCGPPRCSAAPRPSGGNSWIVASWKLDTSSGDRAPAGTEAMASIRGRPMFPAAADAIPPCSSIAARRLVVVVFPFVPVTARKSHRASRYASSTSLHDLDAALRECCG